jgi:hypothetical protein
MLRPEVHATSGVAMELLDDRLESYLTQLMDICSRWSTWITLQEQAAVTGDYKRLEELTYAANGLLTEIQGLQSARQAILAEAKNAGIPNADLYSLAQALPSWSIRSRRERVRTAKRQMDHLRRLHLAIWVLISQCERFASESIQLLTYGQLEASVYSSMGNADTGGGHLLDAQI